MDVEITKQNKTSITDDIGVIKLGPLTVFAGENNAGKTHLVNAISKALEAQGINVVTIPSERVLVEAELEVGAEKDPLRAALGELIDVNFVGEQSITNSIDDIGHILPAEFVQYGLEKMNIAVNTDTPSDDEYTKAIKTTLIKKLIDSIHISDEYAGVDKVSPSSVGQGTQRMIIVALLRYLKRKKVEKEGGTAKPSCIVFEEPEIYLHPKMKATLYSWLRSVAADPRLNTRVILTTHDPYFVEFSTDSKIYKVFRDKKKKYSTNVSPVTNEYLPYESAAEASYLVFDVATPTYFLELYENKKRACETNKQVKEMSYCKFDNDLASKLGEKQTEKDDDGNPVTFITRLRHDLAHSKDAIDKSFKKWGRISIEKLQTYSV